MFCCVALDPASPRVPEVLATVARACSPRVEIYEAAAVFDARGLARVIGSPAEIAGEVQRLAEGHGLAVRVAVAPTMTAAWMLAHARSGCTVAMTDPAEVVASLPVGWLGTLTIPAASAPGARRRPAATRRSAGRSGNYRQAPGPSELHA